MYSAKTPIEREAVRRLTESPAKWIKQILRARLFSYQVGICEAVRKHLRVSVAGCHGLGKSFVASGLGLWFTYRRPGSILLTTAPTWRQVDGIVWREIRKAHAGAAGLGGECLKTPRLNVADDWFALGFSADNADALVGWHARNIMLIVDEACGIDQRLYAGIEGVLSSQGARLFQISNPTDPNTEFAASFQDPNTYSMSISAFDTPNFTGPGITQEDIATGEWEEKVRLHGTPAPYLVTPEWVADKYRRWGIDNPLYISRVLGQFPQEGDSNLISLHWINAAQVREYETKARDRRVLGLDVAREGMDETACYLRVGDSCRKVFTTRKERTTETVGRVIQAFRQNRAEKVNVDAVGVGAGVCDMLDREGIPHSEIKFGASPVNDKRGDFANLKAQLYWSLRDRFETGRIDIDDGDEDLAAQAGAIRWKPNSKGKIEIESKTQSRSNGQGSPDRFEAMVYAFADDVIDSEGFVLVC